MTIDLSGIAATVGMPGEHPHARRVWHVLAMREWRLAWRLAKAANDFAAMDQLDRGFEKLNGV